jgi:nucleoside-diphosphate-sugar epimerase
MRVMVLGATGFIGPHLLRRIAELGHEPIGVSRRGAPDASPGLHIAADRADARVIARLARDHRADAVVDLLAMTHESTAPLLAQLDGVAGRYVLASSGDVYRQYGALHRKEAGGAPLQSLDEDAPLRTSRFPYRAAPPRRPDDPQVWMDGYDKIPIEQAAMAQAGLSPVTVRLPMVFGPGDRQRRFAWAIAPMRAKRPSIDIDAQWAAWRASYGYVEDVAHGLALAAVYPAAAGRTYNLGPLEAPDHEAWARRIAAATGWRGELRLAPRAAVREAHRAALDALDLAYPMVTDSRKIRRELGYRSVVDPEVALRRTIETTA